MVDYKQSDTSIIRIQRNEYPKNSGKYYLDIRRFYWDDGPSPGWRPTRKGISIPWEIAQKILEIAVEELEKNQSAGEEPEAPSPS